MSESTRAHGPSYTPSVPPWIPPEGETRARMAFQAMHPEVGFTFRHRPEPVHWLGYWWDSREGRPRHRTAATLGELVKKIEGEFPAT